MSITVSPGDSRFGQTSFCGSSAEQHVAAAVITAMLNASHAVDRLIIACLRMKRFSNDSIFFVPLAASWLIFQTTKAL
jgi:hypothetical protein